MATSGFLSKVRTASLPVYLFVMVFAMSTWIDIVGVWVEMPLMVNVLPEAWKLPAYLTVIIQCANVGPAIYATVDKFRNSRRSRSASSNNSSNSNRVTASHGACKDPEIILIFLILAVGTLATFVMAFVWSKTVFIFGAERSLPFMVLVLFSSLVSCMSSVVFLPFMARFKPVYISAYYIGQGFCGLVPGLVGLMQGLGKPPNCVNTTLYNQSAWFNETVTVIKPVYDPPFFSVASFLFFLTACMICSGVAFYCLSFLKVSNREMVADSHGISKKNDEGGSTKSATEGTGDSREGESKSLLEVGTEIENGREGSVDHLSEGENNKHLVADGNSQNHQQTVNSVPEVKTEIKHTGSSSTVALLVTIGIVSAMTNGILPATQSYTCLPFGNVIYTLAIRLSSVAGPLASLSSMFLPLPSVRVLLGLTSSATLIAIFHLVLAAQSPTPILQGLLIGEIIVVVSTVVMSACYSFVRVSVASVLREQGSRRALFWCGGVTQLGSFCGAVVTFILVSIFHVFNSAKACV